jgi:hypothetical protein
MEVKQLMSDELLEKVIVSTEIGSPFGAGLKRDQADRFIDYMWDATVLGQQVRQIRLNANELDVQKIGVGERLIRGAQEAVDTGENQGVVFSRISLTTKKIRLDYEITRETLEDNIEEAGFEDHVARMFAEQMGNDLEDLAINGDKTLTGDAGKGINIFDGWRKVLLNGGDGNQGSPLTEGAAHVVDAGGSVLNLGVFNRALRAMPRKFMNNRPALRFFTGSGLISDYLYSIASDSSGLLAGTVGAQIIANGSVRTEGPAGYQTGNAFGVRVQEVPLFNETLDATYSGAGTKDHGEVWLLQPNNLIWAIKREIEIHKEYVAKKDTFEYTVYTRVGLGVENTDAIVVVTNVAAAI